ncbi:hypothetical protein TNCV_2063531 [Trichonephila clavipes]|nr:hypothetical protein TNCV_2063531 [Trichonephila clavipes]
MSSGNSLPQFNLGVQGGTQEGSHNINHRVWYGEHDILTFSFFKIQPFLLYSNSHIPRWVDKQSVDKIYESANKNSSACHIWYACHRLSTPILDDACF